MKRLVCMALFLLSFPLTGLGTTPPYWPYIIESASQAEPDDRFGDHVAVFGDTAFVTAANDIVGGNQLQGAVYRFTVINGTWTETQRITASDGAAYDGFGEAV